MRRWWRKHESVSVSVRSASRSGGVSSCFRSPSFVRRTRIIHPSPYGSVLTSAGSLSSRWFTATTSPATGANSSDTAFTASIVPKTSCRPNDVPDGRELDVDDITELALRVIGDANLDDARLIGGLHVLVLLGVEELLRECRPRRTPGVGSGAKSRGGRHGSQAKTSNGEQMAECSESERSVRIFTTRSSGF